MTLEEVAARVEEIGRRLNENSEDGLTYPDTMTHATLSRIESGKQPYKQQQLEILADIYDTELPALFTRPPRDGEDGIMSVWGKIPSERRAEAIRLLQVIAGGRTGTDG